MRHNDILERFLDWSGGQQRSWSVGHRIHWDPDVILRSKTQMNSLSCGKTHEQRHTCISNIPILILFLTVIADAAQLSGQCERIAAVFDVVREHFHVEEKRITFEEILESACSTCTSSVTTSWSCELRTMSVSCCLTVRSEDGTRERCQLRSYWQIYVPEFTSLQELCTTTISPLDPREIPKIGAESKKKWETRDQLKGAYQEARKELRFLIWKLR